MKISQDDLEMIDGVPGLSRHGGKIRVSLLIPPEMALKIINQAGYERISHWILRHISDIVDGDEKMDRIELKLDRIMEMLKP